MKEKGHKKKGKQSKMAEDARQLSILMFMEGYIGLCGIL